jgi:hypothetical protein
MRPSLAAAPDHAPREKCKSNLYLLPSKVVDRTFPESGRTRETLFSRIEAGREFGIDVVVCAAEVRAAEVHAAEVRAAEVGVLEVRAAEVGVSEVRAPESRTAELRADEVRADEVRVGEVRVGEPCGTVR